MWGKKYVVKQSGRVVKLLVFVLTFTMVLCGKEKLICDKNVAAKLLITLPHYLHMTSQ